MIVLILMGLFGILIQVVMKIRTLRRLTKTMVTSISLKKYLRDEWDNLLLSLLAVIALSFVYQEFIQSSNPIIAEYTSKYTRLLFMTMGYAGADILSRCLSKTQKIITKEIDNLTGNAQGDT